MTTTTRPTIVCLCGSTRFGEAFHEANLKETLAGRIVLTIGCDFKSDKDLELAGTLTPEDKERLDALHLCKIDLADEELMLNVGGYLGESSRRELAHAKIQGKTIRWLEEPCNNTSVGVILLSEDRQSLFLQRRKKFPWGYACPAGHIDASDTSPESAAARELREETGLEAVSLHLATECTAYNTCRRTLGDYHRWWVFQGTATGVVIENPDECEDAGWKSLTEVVTLARRTRAYLAKEVSEEDWQQNPGLEPIWYGFLDGLGILIEGEEA